MAAEKLIRCLEKLQKLHESLFILATEKTEAVKKQEIERLQKLRRKNRPISVQSAHLNRNGKRWQRRLPAAMGRCRTASRPYREKHGPSSKH